MMKGLSQYQQLSIDSLSDQNLNGYQMIQLLLNGLIEKIAAAKNNAIHQNIKSRGENIGSAIDILNVLQMNLNSSSKEQEVLKLSKNLEYLYEYVKLKLLEANLDNRVELLEECLSLLRTVKLSWDEIEKAAVKK